MAGIAHTVADIFLASAIYFYILYPFYYIFSILSQYNYVLIWIMDSPYGLWAVKTLDTYCI